MTRQRNDALVEALSTDFLLRGESLAVAVADRYLSLPGLRGFWSMAPFDSSGNAIDQSGNGRTLTYNGNPTYNYTGFAPYIDLDGTGDYLSRADEVGLDILGTETYVRAAYQGLTMGGWFWTDSTPAGNLGLMGKDDVGVNRSYLLFIQAATRQIVGQVSVDGSTMTSVTNNLSIPDALTWFFAVLRYKPSIALNVTVNGVEVNNAVGIPASIFSGTASFYIGALGGSFNFDGRASLCFLCCEYLSDAILNNLFQSSRGLFGV